MEMTPLLVEAGHQETREGERRNAHALRTALGAGPMVAVVRMLEIYVTAVGSDRDVPEGVLEYLRRAGWIASLDGPVKNKLHS